MNSKEKRERDNRIYQDRCDCLHSLEDAVKTAGGSFSLIELLQMSVYKFVDKLAQNHVRFCLNELPAVEQPKKNPTVLDEDYDEEEEIDDTILTPTPRTKPIPKVAFEQIAIDDMWSPLESMPIPEVDEGCNEDDEDEFEDDIDIFGVDPCKKPRTKPVPEDDDAGDLHVSMCAPMPRH
jgi:hypothetical protein